MEAILYVALAARSSFEVTMYLRVFNLIFACTIFYKEYSLERARLV